jgi:hypothetical protein
MTSTVGLPYELCSSITLCLLASNSLPACPCCHFIPMQALSSAFQLKLVFKGLKNSSPSHNSKHIRHSRNCTRSCKMCGSLNDVAEGSSVLWYDAVLLGEWFPMKDQFPAFWRIIVPSSLGSSSSKVSGLIDHEDERTMILQNVLLWAIFWHPYTNSW